MKKIVWACLTLGCIIFVNWGLAAIFNNNFIDWSFLAGLAVSIFIGFFNSSGGFMSDLADARLQSGNNDEQWAATEVKTKIDRQKRSFTPTLSFYVSIAYTIIAGIVSFIYF
ncbi:hypothetical protein [Niallia sp.]|uniref:hypothetical protein n=1 Tax=Niallia sp. TaxID=2837523 RepID=UPI0028980917|nr:hypothetical protein [Niallia sp.]